MEILIVDDIDLNRVLLKRIVKKHGYKAITFENGREVLNYCEENQNHNKIAAILMDIRMPIMNGIEAAMLIRRLNCKCPIIAVSANQIAQKESLGIFTDVERKPFSPKALLEKIAIHSSTAACIPPIEAKISVN